MSYNYFDKLEVFTRIRGVLVNERPLRIGAGKTSSLGTSLDIAVLRTRLGGNYVPYIPGSSLKGMLRSFAESILRARGVEVHSPWDFNKIKEEAESGKYCPICRIFGSTALASHTRVYDAYPEGAVFTETKISVGINREFKVACPGILFTEEYVAPYVKWKFMMDVINIWICPQPRDELGELMRDLLNALKEGLIQVGARKTVGYGFIRLESAKCTAYEVKDGKLVKSFEGEICG